MSTLFCFPAAAQALAQATNQHQYDLVIVGGGSAGLTAAKLAGGTMKKSVVIIEQDKLGGDCTWTGCIPSKSLLASAKAAHLARKQAISGNGPPVNFAAIQQRYRTNMQEIYEEDDSPQALAKFNVETISGKALLISQTSVQVTSNEKEFVVSAKEGIVLCTGASPRAPTNIPGLQDVDYITYEQVWNLKELPKRLTVVGGGPVRTKYCTYAILSSFSLTQATNGFFTIRIDWM
jgi:pyruvate/2-oxoglutarate dehydrogenase complex dihydrolipoamide dehydrogenase (E3) component